MRLKKAFYEKARVQKETKEGAGNLGITGTKGDMREQMGAKLDSEGGRGKSKHSDLIF